MRIYQYKADMKKSKNLKIVVLKKMNRNQNASLYQQNQSQNNIKEKWNASLSFLSSYIQNQGKKNYDDIQQQSFEEQKEQQQLCKEDITLDFCTTFIKQQQKKAQKTLLTNLFLENRRKKYRVYTQQINRVINNKKILPIQKIKPGIKNLNFSHKNKVELKNDFNDFVTKRKMSQRYTICENQKNCQYYRQRQFNDHKQSNYEQNRRLSLFSLKNNNLRKNRLLEQVDCQDKTKLQRRYSKARRITLRNE